MRKRNDLILFLVSVLLVLSGCSQQSKTINLAICGSYAVPGMFCQNLKGGSFQCEILETDSKGRILFTYATRNEITGRDEKAVVICQSIDDKNVYFYEDICYLLGDPSNEQIETLKVSNDWEKDIDHSKMAKRSNETTLDLNIVLQNDLNTNKAIDLCIDKLSIPSDSGCDLLLVDENQEGQAIFLLTVKTETNEQKYLVMINEEYDIHCVAIDGKTDDLSVLPSFKSLYGWYR